MNALRLQREDGLPLVKICGMRRPEDLVAVREAGADLMGLVFAPSARRLTPGAARELLRAVPGHPPAVGVFVDADECTMRSVIDEVGLSMVQLSGQEAPELATRLPVPYLKTVHLRQGATVADSLHIINSHPTALGFLFDSWSPLGGGSGTAADWTQAAAVIAATDRPVLLAGGLRPDNVAAGLHATAACGADVSSGVERAGWKDPALIYEFVAAVRGFGRAQRDAPVPQSQGSSSERLNRR